jgi:DNA polymerase elongation subunit (family B)
MAYATGWILDVSIEQNRAIVWIRTSEGQIIRLFDNYEPTFYILPKGAEIFQKLSNENSVRKVEWVNKSTDLFDHQMKRLICIYPEPVVYYKTVRKLEKDPMVAELFNTDLTHLQNYLFTKLKIEPTSKVEVEYDDKSHLIKIKKLNDEDVFAPPPFSILHFEIEPSLDADDIILEIRARNEEEILFEGEEGAILNEFCDYVQKEDPDILVSTNKLLDHLLTRMSVYGLDLGRESGTHGRVCLESSLDLPALIERARFGFLPLQMASHYGMNRLIDGRNCYELIQRGFVIPSRGESKNHEPIRTLEEIYAKDKGGMIFSLQVGLHEDVVVLDYENEYANLILRHNLSYETEGHEKGLLPLVLEKVLNRRIFFRNLQKSFSANSEEWNWCEQRVDTLKSILVSLYGTSGSFWNRFANVETFEEINRLSREILIKTKDIVQENGFELLYADTDSVFLKKIGAPIEDYENVKDTLAREIGVPISIEQHYKFLVLLQLEASERMEALKHYFGITHSGDLIARGIEIRRNDAPNFIKEFQTELLYTLFDCNDPSEVRSKGYENALMVITRTIDKIMTGEIQLQDLVVTKKLGQGIEKYRSLFPHVCAAIQLANEGKSTIVGEGVEYIYTNSHHTNPLHRVIPTAFVGQTQHIDYDKEKYRDMLLEAAETVLGYFGFDRTAFGNAPKKRMKWWQHLHEEKLKDRDLETI